ncbi:MAG: SMP-30/gluconolactonase/LRE family protein [Candidatus Brocadiia bacterium]
MRIALCVGVVLLSAAAMAAAPPKGVSVSELQLVVGDLRFTEGPVWHPDGYLIFSDIPADTIYSVRDGETVVYRRPSGNSNGLAFDLEGRLLACEHGNRRVSRTLESGEVVALATHYEGKKLNSPNDLAVRSDGSIYFTDPPYGLGRGVEPELDFQGIFRIGADGELTLLAKGFVKPNGIAFSPDEKVLYVADTERQLVAAFEVLEDGTLGEQKEFARLQTPNRWSGPDGMKVDVAGNLYVTSPGGVHVFDPDGELIELIATPKNPTNCAFGGPDGRTLFVTAQDSVYRVQVKNAGDVWTRRFVSEEEEAPKAPGPSSEAS